MKRPALRLTLLAALFFLSGAASLIDQVVWLRYLSLTFGNTTQAAATLLAVFMAGLGFGALLFGRFADRLQRPLALYALVELALALAALFSPRLFAWIDGGYIAAYRAFGEEPALFALVRVALATATLLPPTLLMGGTLPLMVRAVTAAEGEVGRRVSLFYAVNTLGATAGVALAGFVTIRWLGLSATLLVAAGFNLLVALGCLALSRPRPRAAHSASAARPPGWLPALFFAMGLTSLAYEVLWTRVLVLHLGSSVYAYSLMLVLFLAGLAAGSFAAMPWADRLRRPLAALAAIELALGLWVLAQVPLFARLGESLRLLSERLMPTSFAAGFGVQLLGVAPLLLPPTFLMGLSFPIALRAFHREFEALGREVGTVYAANTLGSIAGSLAAGFVAIPLLGTQASLFVAAILNAALGALVFAQSARRGELRGRLAPRLAWLAPAALVAGLALTPADRVILGAGIFRGQASEDLVHFEEDSSATVTIRRLRDASGPYLSLELNGVNVAGTSHDLDAVQRLQGHLPLLLAGEAKRVVHIGFGSGGTAHAVAQHPVEEIRIVEISPAVLDASDRTFGDVNFGVLRDRRVAVEINDGRNFMLASPRLFDAVLSDSIHPRYAGNGSLYTEDYFRLIRERLAPGGVVSMWLPTYSLLTANYAMVVRAFAEVFPHTTVWYEPSALNAFTIVTGRLAERPWDGEALASAFARREVARPLAELGIAGPADLLACYLAGGEELAAWLSRFSPHVDDLPAVEYDSGMLLDRDRPWLATFAALLALRPAEPPADYLAALSPDERARARALWGPRATLLASHRDFLAARLGSAPAPGR